MANIINKEHNSNTTWYTLRGVDDGTRVHFDNEVVGITQEGNVVDSEGYPLSSQGDRLAIAVRNTLRADEDAVKAIYY